jgi:hypothetical protein
MKRNLIIGGIVLVFGLLGIARVTTPEDGWFCAEGQWVKHGNPSTPHPETKCNDQKLESPEQIDFIETGHFMKDAPGLKPGVWYLSYEKPGSPALYKELVFDEMSLCTYNTTRGKCPDVLLPSSAMTRVRGVIYGDVVWVSDAVSGVSGGI